MCARLESQKNNCYWSCVISLHYTAKKTLVSKPSRLVLHRKPHMDKVFKPALFKTYGYWFKNFPIRYFENMTYYITLCAFYNGIIRSKINFQKPNLEGFKNFSIRFLTSLLQKVLKSYLDGIETVVFLSFFTVN